jgi:hypothetical protein
MKNRKSTKNGQEFSKVLFPSWDEIVFEYIQRNCSDDTKTESNYFKSFFDKIDKIRSIGFGNHIAETMTLAIESTAFLNPEIPRGEIVDLIKKSMNEINEFYSVFELNSGNFIELDVSIEKKLGMKPEIFTIPNLFALNPSTPLFHKSDVCHVIRWAGIAYGVLGLPSFKVDDFSDYYKISFRIPTDLSSNLILRNKKFITLEKKCFLYCDTPSKSLKFPKYHFDRWSIYDAENFTYVQPQFISSVEQTDKLNTLAYLMNAFLLDINPKYLLMLNQKRFSDRNKEIANNINENLEQKYGIIDYFTENQVADSFAKTIRNKVQGMSEKWDFIDDKKTINSDQQALEICNQYGLTPIPRAIEELIYNCITLE